MSIIKSENRYNIDSKFRESPCFLVTHQRNVVLLRHRFDCFEDRVSLMSVENNEDEYEENEKKMKITVFSLNASAKCFAPNVPI